MPSRYVGCYKIFVFMLTVRSTQRKRDVSTQRYTNTWKHRNTHTKCSLLGCRDLLSTAFVAWRILMMRPDA